MTNTVRNVDVPQVDPTVALESAAREAARITGAEGAAIAFGNASAMCCCASSGDAPGVGVLVNRDSGLSGFCLRTGEVVLCDDTANDPRIDPAAGRRMNLKSVLIVPVMVDGRLQAILEVVSSRPHAFTMRHRDELLRMAQGIATLLSESAVKKGPKSATKDHRASATSAEESGMRAVAPAPAVTPLASAAETVAPPPISVRGVVPEAAAQETEASAREAPEVKVLRDVFAPAAPPSFSTTAKAAIAIVAVVVLALGWFLLGTMRSGSTTKVATAASPNGQKAGAEAEITVEQSSLSVGQESAKVAGSAPQLTPGQLVRKVDPVYPSAALARGIGGTVVLKALVTKEGKVANVQFVRGPEELSEPAMDAVRQWIYEPYRFGREPVAGETMISIKFTPRPQR